MKALRIACRVPACLAAIASCDPIPTDAVQLVPTDALSQDLVAHWSFDEGMGPTVKDDSGHGFDGTLTGGMRITDGRFGGAINFHLGDHVKVTNFHDVPPPITISAWTRLTAADLLLGWGSIVSTEIDKQGGWTLYLNYASKVPIFEFEYALPSSHPSDLQTIDQASIAPDVWHHLTAVVNDSTMMLYDGTEAAAVTPVTMPLGAGGSTLYIGFWSGSDGEFSGAIDEVRIYRRALSPAEIKLLDQGSSGK